MTNVTPMREDMSNGCPQAEALDRQTVAIQALTDAVTKGMHVLQPAAEAVADLGQAQKKFCAFMVAHRVKILLAVPAVLTAIGAISPSAAEGLRTALHAWGVQ